MPNQRATEDQVSANSKNSKMGGILSTIFGLKSGDAKGTNVDQPQTNTNVDQPQTNHGNRGPAVTHGDQSGSSRGDYAAPG